VEDKSARDDAAEVVEEVRGVVDAKLRALGIILEQ
jgi:hypothetical protein